MSKIIKQTIDKLTQDNINNFFLTSCKNGDLEAIQGLFLMYKPKIQSGNKIFSYFLEITQNLRIGVNPHYNNDEGIKFACENNHIDIVSFLTQSKNFVKTINRNNSIFSSFYRAIKSENIEVAKFIHSLISDKSIDHETYKECLYDSFINSCYEGKFESIKYLLTDSSIPKHWMDHYPRTEPIITAGFIAACEGGQPNVVRYFTNNYDFDDHFRCLNRSLNINNIEVMQHFIIDLGFAKDDYFIKNIYCSDIPMLNKLFEKTELFHDLESNLKQDNTKESIISKKLKV